MKIKTTFSILAFMFITISMNAQKLTLSQVLETLTNMEVFVENRKLKKNTVKAVETTARKEALTLEEYERLKLTYEELAYIYNDVYLATIKADLSNTKQIKKMIKKPEEFSAKYANSYKTVVNYYNDEFTPDLAEIQGLDSNADLGTLIAIGTNIYEKIVALIGKKKDSKEQRLQLVLTTINKMLFKKLQMPAWSDLNIEKPNTAVSLAKPVAKPPVSSTNPAAVKNTSGPERGWGRPPLNVPPSTNVPVVLEAMEGSIIFNKWTDGDILEPMAFEKGKTETVETPNIIAQGDQITGKPGGKSNPVKTETFRYQSTEEYASDTYYRLGVEGNGLVYIFAVNSNNKMYGFFPSSGGVDEVDSGASFVISNTRDMSVGKPGSTPNNTNTMISIPDDENYIHIRDSEGVAAPESETLVVILSRTEINLKDVMTKMEELGDKESVQSRLAAIFGNTAATADQADVSMDNGKLSFKLAEGETNILPLTFSIMRK